MSIASVRTARSATAVLDADQMLRAACEETDLARAAWLREQVVLQHRRWAIGLAHRFEHHGVDGQDLEQVAMIGLVQAARRYRPDRGAGFAAFAAPTVLGEVKRYFRDHGWGVRPPRSLQELHLEVRQATNALAQELGRAPRVEEIAERIGRSPSDVRNAQGAATLTRCSSLDAPVGDDDGLTVGDTVGAPEEGFGRVEEWVALRPLLQTLSPRERLILRLRFVDELTQRQIGQRIGVSQMQVSRLLGAILGRLRADMEGVDASTGTHRPVALTRRVAPARTTSSATAAGAQRPLPRAG